MSRAGGSALLWQHLFWMFGHPWVYAIVLPAMGMVSDGLPVFCRRPLVGYTVVALATVATMVLGFGVWVHHMFATGLPGVSLSFFSAASIIIAVPSAVGVFAWLATIWTGRPVFTTPFLFFASFIILFTIGGVSGYMTGSVPVDWQLTDTYFVVAHLHYVLIGINVFPVVGATYFWFPKFTGRMMDERLGRWNFWTMFIGFNLGFFPMHISGLLGMPRRIYTYAEGMGWDWVNLITTLGSFLFGIGVLIFVWNVVKSLKRGAPAGDNPWDAPTLEWATSSPPPPYNFAVIPIVASRHPLWEDRLGSEGEHSHDRRRPGAGAWPRSAGHHAAGCRAQRDPENARRHAGAAAAGAGHDHRHHRPGAGELVGGGGGRRCDRRLHPGLAVAGSGAGRNRGGADRWLSASAWQSLPVGAHGHPRQRLVGDDLHGLHRSLALRLSAVQLIITWRCSRTRPAPSRKAAPPIAGPGAAQHRHPAGLVSVAVGWAQLGIEHGSKWRLVAGLGRWARCWA